MENSLVNKAHYQLRRAENHLRYKRFDEAMNCHQKGAEYLDEALNFVTVPRAIESLKLQKDYHKKQQEIIKTKKDQFDSYKKVVENQRKRMANAFANNEYDGNQNNQSITLQIAIYKTMEEADSLLEMLIRKGPGSDSDSLKSDVSNGEADDKVVTIDTVDGESSRSNTTPIGRKQPKDENIVIEELKTLNQQLHSLVDKLVTQLEESTREADSLRARLKFLENERLRHAELSAQHETSEIMRNNLRVITDSSGATSPYVFSPCSELSPEAGENRVIPPLAPLDLPTFDFSNLTKTN